VLSRAVWSSRKASQILLRHLIVVFAPTGVLVMGLDDTIERRRGKRIAAKGIYRDPVRSSDSHLVKASGLRWLSLMLLVPIPCTAGLGITVSNRLSPFTTLPRTAKSSTQAADGLGQTNDKASAAMVAEANDGCGCR